MKRMILIAALACAACQSTSTSKAVGPAPAAGDITAAELETATIASVDIAGLESLPRASVRLAIRSQAGDPIARSVLRGDLRRIMAIRGVADVRVDAVRVGTGIGLRYVVAEAERIAGIDVDGNSALSDADLVRLTKLQIGGALDPLAVRDGAAHIRRRYRVGGYYRADVSWKVSTPGDGAVIVYSVDEGPKVSIEKVTFPGARALAQAELSKLLAGKSTWNAVGAVLVDDDLTEGVLRITGEYYDRGYINLTVGKHVVKDVSSDRVELVIPIEEGPQFRLGTIAVTGKLAAPVADYLGVITSKTGDVFNRSKVGADILALAAFQQQATGNRDDFITPLTNVDPDKHTVDIRFEIDR